MKADVYDLLLGEVSLDEAAMETQLQFLRLIPSSTELVGAEVELAAAPERERALAKALHGRARPLPGHPDRHPAVARAS